MKAELISIGDEILIGQVVNTNAVWMAKKLNAIGVHIHQITTVGDDKNQIITALKEALTHSDIVLITGGLGPTNDDITKMSLAEFLNQGFRKDLKVLEFIKSNFEKRHIEFLPVHEFQAEVLQDSEVLFNHYGTAPGMWIALGSKVVIVMPGVPYEMKGIMNNYALEKIKNTFKLPSIYHKTLVVSGLPESTLANKISEVENNLPPHIKLAYLPHFGIVRLRLSGKGNDADLLKEEIETFGKQILEKLDKKDIVATDDLTPQEIVGSLLLENGQTLSIAESCTGGHISHLITTVPGSSQYFIGSLIAYSYEVKMNDLNVKATTLEKFGAVSEECVVEMANGIKKKFKTDFAISTTGIAGPGGATDDKPVGMVWIAVATPNAVITRMIMGNGERLNVIERTSVTALDMLRRSIIGLNPS